MMRWPRWSTNRYGAKCHQIGLCLREYEALDTLNIGELGQKQRTWSPPHTTCDLGPPVFKLLATEADSLVGLVDVDHYRFDFFAFLQNLARMIDLPSPTQIGHVNHSVDAIFEFYKRTISSEVADLSLDDMTNRVTAFDIVPGIGLELANSQGNFLFLGVDRKNLTVLVTRGECLVRGERKRPESLNTMRPVFVEQPWGQFERKISLPGGALPESVNARYEEGLLEITVPIGAAKPPVEHKVEVV